MTKRQMRMYQRNVAIAKAWKMGVIVQFRVKKRVAEEHFEHHRVWSDHKQCPTNSIGFVLCAFLDRGTPASVAMDKADRILFRIKPNGNSN